MAALLNYPSQLIKQWNAIKTQLITGIDTDEHPSLSNDIQCLVCLCRDGPWHDDSSFCKTFLSSMSSWKQHEDK